MNAKGDAQGITRVFGHEFDTTGVLGVSKDRDGDVMGRSFPWWLTIPDNRWLSMARSWHFFFAWVLVVNGIAYLGWSIGSRHLARDLAPDRNDLRSIGQSIRDHLRFRHPTGEAAKRYNVLQKLAYLGVIFVLAPLDRHDGPRDVTLGGHGAGQGGSAPSAAASRHGRSISSLRGCWSDSC